MSKPIHHSMFSLLCPAPSGGGQFAEGIGAFAAPQGRRKIVGKSRGKMGGIHHESYGRYMEDIWNISNI